MAERNGSTLPPRRRPRAVRRFESCCLRLRSGVVESVRHATVTREAQVRALPPEPRRLLAVGELATPPAPEAGDRRFDSCQPDLRGRGAAVLASLMSSRPWVRIPPALSLVTSGSTSPSHDDFTRIESPRNALVPRSPCRSRRRRFEDVAQRQEHPPVERTIAGSSPVVLVVVAVV